jgi:hypothetical protein
MMYVGKHRVKSHMTIDYLFSGIRILEGALVPVDWNISLDLVAIDKKGKLSSEDPEYNATVAYQKIFFWLETNLPNIVVVDVTNNTDLYIANLSSNIMLYSPVPPYDDAIVQLLHSKLSVLVEGNLLIGEMRIKASDMAVQYTFDIGEAGYNLPTTTAEYYVDGKARDELPWWMRDDGFSFEFIRPDNSELTTEELFKDVIDPLTEFYKIINEGDAVVLGAPKEPARIIQVEKWTPKKV